MIESDLKFKSDRFRYKDSVKFSSHTRPVDHEAECFIKQNEVDQYGNLYPFYASRDLKHSYFRFQIWQLIVNQ